MPISLPVDAREAIALAELVLDHAEGRELNDELRARLAARLATLNLRSMEIFPASLVRDPIHRSAYYLAADGMAGPVPQSLLLRIAPASAPASGLFPQAQLIVRQRAATGIELLVDAIPFSTRDYEALRTFAEQVDDAFLPRPQGARAAIAAGNRHPEISLPAIFEAYRVILKTLGLNMASTPQLSATREMTTEQALAERDGEDPTAAGHTRVSIRHLYHAGLWAAIRAGWREGYSAEADHIIISGATDDDIRRSVEAAKEAIRQAAGYTKFTTDTSRLIELRADPRHPEPWSEVVVRERFEYLFSPDERRWILAEFARPFQAGDRTYRLEESQIRRLAVKFGPSLKLHEELYDWIREVKSTAPGSRSFDFEPSLDEAETLTTPEELLFCMHWLKARGRPAQLVPPNLGFKKRQAYPSAMESSPEAGVGLRDYVKKKMWPELVPRVERDFGGRPLEELGARVAELAAVARHFNATLSIHSGSGKQAEVLRQIGRATAGRVNYKISGELQLQLFDVLSEQPPGSYWRQLYERMVRRAEAFAEKGAFGEESALAAYYRQLGRGDSLGDAARGRVDGNLFLVFWLGNVVGSRDVESPDGDQRFFKEKLDELPAELVREVRRRNTRYIVWLAEQLRG
ncbi:MAG: tagaturonate epimerase family protein [Bryobacteraceae bacterium]|nr:tagaturonate epimerase family protein [Bryobacteraceae bacterium]